MRIPLSWLGEYVDLAPNTTPASVHAALVKVGFEEEAVHSFELTGPIVVGQVLSFEPEPQTNGKTINWCQVDVGAATELGDGLGDGRVDGPGRDIRGIVCGAHNFIAGDKVVVSLPGAVLPGPFPIAARTTYGHVSDGMIASARELGLGEEHDGILRLASLGLDPEPGTDAIALLGLDDSAVEVNVTPDRGYAFSVRGIAREYAHSTGATFRDPAEAPQLAELLAVAPTGFFVEVRDDMPIRGRVGASVFVTRVVRGIDPSRPTPSWMIARLTLAGIRSISLVVDITNYVMLELGQPIHGYDLGKLSGGMTVRRAHAGETLVTLDDRARALHLEDLVIADDSGAIGLAGVMGGGDTEIGADTTDVLIEAANFDPVSIARTARRHRLPSEASKRFERGVDPAIAPIAAARVAQLLVSLAGGTADTLGSVLERTTDERSIRLPHGFLHSLVGVDFTDDEIRTSLTEIGTTIDDTDGGWSVTPPSWRPDLTDAATLAEEVARIVGYDRIPSVLPVAPPGRGLTREQRLRRGVAQQLAASGATEVLSYPFVSAKSNDTFGADVVGEVPAVKLANPLDAQVPFMRTSLLPGLIDIARRNLSRGLSDLALFEIGNVVRPVEPIAATSPLPRGDARPSPELLAELHSAIPPQPRFASGLLLGDAVHAAPRQAAIEYSIADALDTVRAVTASVGAELRVVQGTHHALHPGRTATLWVGGERVGIAGELLPALADDLDLPRRVAVWELDLDAVIRLAPVEPGPIPIASLPAATQDLSLVVPVAAVAGEVLSAVREGAGSLLENIRLTDDYRGQGMLPGMKSLTFALRFRAPDRTLTAAEATSAKLAGAALAAERYGSTVRG